MQTVSRLRPSMVRRRCWCRVNRERSGGCSRSCRGAGIRACDPRGLRLALCAVEEMLESSRRLVQGIASGRLSIPMYSTVTGGKVSPTSCDAEILVSQPRQTVRFANAVEQRWTSGHRFFVEVSPHPVLSLALQENARSGGSECRDCGHAAPGPGEAERLLLSLGELHVRGLAATGSHSCRQPGLCRCRPIRLSGSATGWRPG